MASQSTRARSARRRSLSQTRTSTTIQWAMPPKATTAAIADEWALAPVEQSDLRQRLLKRKGRTAGPEPIDMTVFERLPDSLLHQQAELGVEAAQRELARRRIASRLSS